MGINIAHILLNLHGMPILQDLDGRVLEEALTDGFINYHEVLIETVKHSKSTSETEGDRTAAAESGIFLMKKGEYNNEAKNEKDTTSEYPFIIR